MNRGKLRFCAVLLAATLPFSSVQAQEMTLQSCQYLQDEIDRYTKLRKRGGSSQEMEYWRQQRNVLKDKFAKHKCSVWGRKLD